MADDAFIIQYVALSPHEIPKSNFQITNKSQIPILNDQKRFNPQISQITQMILNVRWRLRNMSGLIPSPASAQRYGAKLVFTFKDTPWLGAGKFI